MVLLAASTGGGYFALAKIILLLALAIPWLLGCVWVDKDTHAARMRREIWLTAAIGAGVLGLLLWLVIPSFIVGLALYVVLVAAVAAVYVTQRNAKVIPEARVLTGEWFGRFATGRKDRSVNVVAKLKVYDHTGQPAVVPDDGSAEEKEIYNGVQDLLHDMMWRRASEADLAPSTEEMSVRYVIDGMVVRCDPMPRPLADEVIEYVKSLAGMDPEQKRRPQNGKISVDLAGEQVDVELVAAGTTSGPRMQVKVIQEAVRTRIGELGLPEQMLAALRDIRDRSAGLVIAASKPRNGLTSTLYSLMRDNDAYTKQLMSVEAAPEADLEGVTQNVCPEDDRLANAVAGCLRRDPDVLMVDRCKTADAAEKILEGAAVKRMVVGVNARDSFNALAKWVKAVGDPAKAVKPLDAVLSQVLLRKLCPDCREAYQPPADLLKKTNLPADKVDRFYRPPTEPLTDEKGRPMICPTCQGSGYYGRTAAFELLVLNSELRKLIASGANLTQIKAAARKNKMLYLQEQALRLVMDGVTSVQEVIRVTRTKEG